jgi:hypothetical protein
VPDLIHVSLVTDGQTPTGEVPKEKKFSKIKVLMQIPHSI